MFRMNGYGIGLLVLTGIVVNFIARPLLPGKEPLWMAIGGTLLIVADVFLRGRQKAKVTNGSRWLSGEYGATIAFPAWILGLCFIGFGAAKQFGLVEG